MAGARSLWRANGRKNDQFDKPVIAIANSFTQFVPGHVHLRDIGQHVKSVIESYGWFAAEFNTIAIDDGIAMGHSGMLYSLPSRDLIADSVEYMCNAHKVDALFCIPNCDKIVPGMLMAAMRLNIPVVFVSGGPMEAGVSGKKKYDLIDAMVMAGDKNVSDDEVQAVENVACPTCGSCSGMFTANSMNCLSEALGIALPGNGTVVATHTQRTALFEKGARTLVEITKRYYEQGDTSVLPRSIATKKSFMNAMALDIAMGGSTNTVLHLLAIAQNAGVDFTMEDIHSLSRKIPIVCKVAPSSHYHVEDVNRAGGIMAILGELARNDLVDPDVYRVEGETLGSILSRYDIRGENPADEALTMYKSAPGGKTGVRTLGSQQTYYKTLDTDAEKGCIRDFEHCYNREGGLCILYGNIARNGCIVKTAGVDESIYTFTGTARVFESQDQACEGILNGEVKANDVVVIRYEGPRGGPGMQEMLYPTSYIKSVQLDKACALITDGRFSGGTAGLSIGHVSPEAAAGGEIALLRDNDTITIDIPNRTIDVQLSDEELQKRKNEELQRKDRAFTPGDRTRNVSAALRMYGEMATSADKGAVRKIT